MSNLFHLLYNGEYVKNRIGNRGLFRHRNRKKSNTVFNTTYLVEDSCCYVGFIFRGVFNSLNKSIFVFDWISNHNTCHRTTIRVLGVLFTVSNFRRLVWHEKWTIIWILYVKISYVMSLLLLSRNRNVTVFKGMLRNEKTNHKWNWTFKSENRKMIKRYSDWNRSRKIP